MATDTKATTPALVPYRLTVRQFEKMIDADVFPAGAHVELLGGRLVQKMTKNDPHDAIVGELATVLRSFLPGGRFVREEKNLRLGRHWRPAPDIAISRGQPRDFSPRSPRAEDIESLIEVANTSYAKDRGVLWRRYAASRIASYWIINLPMNQIEVYTRPAGRGNSAGYLDCATYGRDDEVPVVVEGIEVGRVAVRDLLP